MDYVRLAYEEDVVLRADKQTHIVTRDTLGHVATEVEGGKTIKIGDVLVTPIVVDHHVVVPAFGYRIDSGGYSIVISGDTTYSENLVRHSTGADVLVHSVMSPALQRYIETTLPPDVAGDILALHISAPDVGRVFSETGVRLGVLTHLDNDPAGTPELADQVRSTFDGELVVGEDLMTIEIGESIHVVVSGK